MIATANQISEMSGDGSPAAYGLAALAVALCVALLWALFSGDES